MYIDQILDLVLAHSLVILVCSVQIRYQIQIQLIAQYPQYVVDQIRYQIQIQLFRIVIVVSSVLDQILDFRFRFSLSLVILVCSIQIRYQIQNQLIAQYLQYVEYQIRLQIQDVEFRDLAFRLVFLVYSTQIRFQIQTYSLSLVILVCRVQIRFQIQYRQTIVFRFSFRVKDRHSYSLVVLVGRILDQIQIQPSSIQVRYRFSSVALVLALGLRIDLALAQLPQGLVLFRIDLFLAEQLLVYRQRNRLELARALDSLGYQ